MANFGPQSPNYSTARPASDAVVQTLDTWFVDCSAAGANDGTVVTASWLNMINAQISEACVQAGLTIDTTDDTMLWQAIEQAVTNGLATLTASRGLNKVGNDFQMDLGAASNGVLNFTTSDRINDTLPVWDASLGQVREIAIYDIVKAVLQNVQGVTFNDATGTIDFEVRTHTTAAVAPVGVTFGDTWYDSTTDILHMWTTDGTSSFWLQIS